MNTNVGVKHRATIMQLIDGPSAWTRRDVRPEEYRIDLSAACLDEIRRAADEIRAYPLPTVLRTPDDFTMPACRWEMARVRDMLDHECAGREQRSGTTVAGGSHRIQMWPIIQISQKDQPVAIPPVEVGLSLDLRVRAGQRVGALPGEVSSRRAHIRDPDRPGLPAAARDVFDLAFGRDTDEGDLRSRRREYG